MAPETPPAAKPAKPVKQKKPPPRGIRRVVRIIARLGAFAFALSLLALAATLLLLQTDWGRNQLRAQLEHQLAGAFPGGAKIGKLEGSVFSTLTLRDVELDGRDGKPMITVGSLAVDVALKPLIHRTVHVNRIAIDHLVIDIHPQPPAPPEPAKPPEPDEPQEAGAPSAWAIEVPKLALEHASVVIATGSGAPIAIDDIELDVSAEAPAPHAGARAAPPVTATLWTQATVRGRGTAQVAAMIEYDRDRNELYAPMVSAQLATAAVTGFGVHVKLGAQPDVTGVIAARASRQALTALGVPASDVDMLAAPGPAGDAVDLVVEASAVQSAAHRADFGDTRIALTARAGQAIARGSFDIDIATARARGVMLVDDEDLAAVTAGFVHGHGQIVAAIEANASQAHGMLSIASEVDVGPPVRGIVSIDAKPDRVIAVTSLAGAYGSRVSLLGEASADKTGAWKLTRGTLTARIPDVDRTSGGRLALHGPIVINASARGALTPAPKLAIGASVDGDHLQLGTLTVAQIHTTISALDVPAAPDAYIHVDVAQAKSSPSLGVATAALDVRALAPPDRAITIDILKHQIQTLTGASVTGRGGKIVIARSGDRIELRAFSTALGTGQIIASGSFAPKSQDLSANLQITELALASAVPGVQGTADGTVAIARRGGRWSGTGDLSVRKLVAVAGKPAIDTQLLLAIDGPHVTARASVGNDDIGNGAVDVDVDGPRDLTDVAAWRALPRKAIRRLSLEIDKLDVDAAIAASGVDPALAPVHGGGFTGSIALTPGGASGELVLAQLQAQSVAGPIAADLKIDSADPTELSASGTVTVDGVGAVGIDAHASLPPHLFEPSQWAALDRGALRSAAVTIAEQAFDPAKLAKLGVVSALTGKVALAINVGPGADSAHVDIDAKDVTGGTIVKPVAVHTEAELDRGNGLVVHGDAHAGPLALISFRATAPVTPAQVFAGDVVAIRALPVTGEVAIAKLDLPTAFAVVNRSDIIAGILDGKIDVAGTLAVPTASGTITATDVTVGAGLSGTPLPKLNDLTVAVKWGGASGEVNATAHESNGGLLTLIARGGLADLATGYVALTAKDLDLAPLAAFAPDPLSASAGVLNGQITLAGFVPATAKLTGHAVLSKGRMPLSPTAGTLRELETKVDIDGATLKVDATAKIGPGDVHATATVALGSKLTVTSDARLHHFSPIGSIRPVIDGEVHTDLAFADGKATGNIKVTHGVVTVQLDDDGHKLLASGEPSDMQFVDAAPPPPKGMHIDAPEDPWLVMMVDIAPMQINADEVRGSVKASGLKLSYGDEVGLDGYIDIDRGDVDLFGRRYEVELGLLTFDGGTDPELSISVSHSFPDLTTYTDVGGRASAPELTLRGDPANYTQGQLLGFLLGGEPGGDPSAEARDEAATVGASLLSAMVSRKINKVLPVHFDVRCLPSTSQASALCTAGKWVNQKLYIGAKQHLDPLPDENSSEGDLEYYLLTHVILEATGGDRNDSVDLLWRKRW